jgi:hypothetical protein
MLPTVEDMLMDYQWIRFDLKTSSNSNKEPTVSEISDVMANKIKDIWRRASIPTVTVTRMVQLIKGHHEKYTKLLWYPASRRSEEYDKKVNDLRDQTRNHIFDIAACKCTDFSLCKCEKSSKVPAIEQKCLQDQRNARQMMIGGIDRVTTKKLQERKRRKSQVEDRLTKYQLDSSSSQAAAQFADSASCHFGSDTEASLSSTQDELDADTADIMSPQAVDEENTSGKVSMQQRRRLKNTARASERHAVSDRAAAEIASAVLQDYGIVNAEDCSEVIDRSKMRRERQKYRDTVCAKAGSCAKVVQGIYFDGRKDKTLSKEMVDGTAHRRVIVEEHVVLVQEPGSSYVGHITPASGSSSSMQAAIVTLMQECKRCVKTY